MNEILPHIQRVDALREHIVSFFNLNRFVTASFNLHGLSTDQGRKRLRFFLRDTEKKLFGKRVNHLPATERLDGIIFPEHIGSNFHYHMTLQVPPSKLEQFDSLAPKVWERVFDAGSIHIQNPLTHNDWKKVVSYVTKESHKELNFENFVLLREFWSSNSLKSKH